MTYLPGKPTLYSHFPPLTATVYLCPIEFFTIFGGLPNTTWCSEQACCRPVSSSSGHSTSEAEMHQRMSETHTAWTAGGAVVLFARQLLLQWMMMEWCHQCGPTISATCCTKYMRHTAWREPRTIWIHETTYGSLQNSIDKSIPGRSTLPYMVKAHL